MRKNRHIFLLGALFFLFALVKYAFIGGEIPTTFIVFEILSFFVILYIIYYILNFIETCMHGSDEAGMNKECVKRQAEISRLKSKLKAFEQERLNGGENDDLDSDLFISSMKSKIGSDRETTVKDLLKGITDRYEVMAAVGYCSNDEKQYVPVSLYGIDEETSIPPIELEDGLHAQAIADNKAMEISDVPADYIEVGSGSGNTRPLVLYILPLINEGSGIVLEIAAFKKLDLVDVWNQLGEDK
ncbi:GAF domain-containing protein [Carboxylicivirga sp. RSCT41]|uniref:GAF domain-containing protein n=1 Tax=Carboxylicivirga agarovorans TaxID=3417570 RepID=UPI003D3528B2